MLAVCVCGRQKDLKLDERPVLERALAEDEGLDTGYQFVRRFRHLIAEWDMSALTAWLVDAEASGLPSYVTLAHGTRAEYAAVEAALETEWSNGSVEGHVHRVTLVKRQGVRALLLRLDPPPGPGRTIITIARRTKIGAACRCPSWCWSLPVVLTIRPRTRVPVSPPDKPRGSQF